MNKNKLSAIFIVATMLCMFSFTSVSAAANATNNNLTVTIPGSGGIMKGATYGFNCSLDAGYEAENYTWGNFSIYSAGKTANTTSKDVWTGYNLTAPNQLNGTFATTAFEDGNDYVVTCVLKNGTNTLTKSRTGIIIDNTVPDSPTLSPSDATSIIVATTQNFSATVNNSETTSCTYTIYRGGGSSDGTSGSAGYSGTSCSFTKTFASSADNGDWLWTIIASDESNTTAATTIKFVVNIPAAGGGVPAGVDITQSQTGQLTISQPTTSRTNMVLWLIGIVVAIIVVAVLINRRNN